MRCCCLLALALVGLAACDDAPAAAGRDAAPPIATEAATEAATASPPPPPKPAAAAPMPPRPVPIGSSGPIQPSAPSDQQMMAIAYTLAMVTPRANDPLIVDKVFLDDVLKKLDGALRGLDKGKTPANAVKATKGNRKIEVEMGHGCTDHVPAQLLQRTSTTLQAAYDAGVLVVSCHDDKWECHQSTRDPKDVLCHAAPRR